MILLLRCPCFINQPSKLCQVLDPPQPSFIFLLLGNNFLFVVDKISSTILHNLYILAYLASGANKSWMVGGTSALLMVCLRYV